MLRKGAFSVLVFLALVGVLEVSSAQSPGTQATQSALFPILAIAVAAVSLIVALFAVHSARRARADFQRFSRSIEMALRDIASRSDRDAASLGELNRRIGEEIRALTELAEAGERQSPPAPAGAGGREGETQPAMPAPVERAAEVEAAAPEAIRASLVEAIAQGTLEVSLQPIISVSQSAATGFEVHAHVEPEEGGRPIEIRRLMQSMPGLDQTNFEAAMIRAATAAGRRQLGTATERMPFHVAISEALLGSASEVDAVAELARVHRPLTASLVLSIPAALLGARGETRERLEKLTATGFRLAAEGWEGEASDIREAKARGVHFLKLPANRLLDRERIRRKALSGAELAEAAAAAGVTVIATGVARDDDAVGLIDLGVDMMEGERFSGPRRMRSSAARQAALANM